MKGILFAWISVKKKNNGGKYCSSRLLSGNELLKKYKIGGTFLIKVDDTITMTIKCTDSIEGDLI